MKKLLSLAVLCTAYVSLQAMDATSTLAPVSQEFAAQQQAVNQFSTVPTVETTQSTEQPETPADLPLAQMSTEEATAYHKALLEQFREGAKALSCEFNLVQKKIRNAERQRKFLVGVHAATAVGFAASFEIALFRATDRAINFLAPKIFPIRLSFLEGSIAKPLLIGAGFLAITPLLGKQAAKARRRLEFRLQGDRMAALRREAERLYKMEVISSNTLVSMGYPAAEAEIEKNKEAHEIVQQVLAQTA